MNLATGSHLKNQLQRNVLSGTKMSQGGCMYPTFPLQHARQLQLSIALLVQICLFRGSCNEGRGQISLALHYNPGMPPLSGPNLQNPGEDHGSSSFTRQRTVLLRQHHHQRPSGQSPGHTSLRTGDLKAPVFKSMLPILILKSSSSSPATAKMYMWCTVGPLFNFLQA